MEVYKMRKIQRLSELLELKQTMQMDFMNYLEGEFYSLYEYLSNGEIIEEFQLENHQAMVIIEKANELDLLTKDNLELEYIEEIQIKSNSCLRIGILQLEDIQLHYFLKG